MRKILETEKQTEEKKKVYLIEVNKSKYEIIIAKSLHQEVSPHCTITPKEIKDIKSHLLITAYHPLGAGIGGWDDYTENLAVIKTDEFSKELLLDHAKTYAKMLATKICSKYVDPEEVKKIRKQEKKVQDAQNKLESMVSE